MNDLWKKIGDTNMKKYISVILINVLLFQFCGCYTLKTYTYDEFRIMEDISEASVFYDIDKEVTINSDSLAIDYTIWIADTDTLRIYSPQLTVPLYERESLKSYTIRIAKNQVKEVKVRELHLGKTIVSALGLVLISMFVIALVAFELDDNILD